MKTKVVLLLILLAMVFSFAGVAEAQEETALRFYLVPSEFVQQGPVYLYGPKYFQWRWGSGTLPVVGSMDYGFVNQYLVLADLSQGEHDALMLNTDVFSFDEAVLDDNIDVADMQALRDFFEGFNMPTDWLTPSNTYRELLRQTVGVFQFGQRYAGVSASYHLDIQVGITSISDTTFSDVGQDFNEWGTATPETQFRIEVEAVMADGKRVVPWGFLGPAVSGSEIQIYRDRAMTDPGWIIPSWLGSVANIDSITGYAVILARPEDLFTTVDLDSSYRDMSAKTQLFFDATVESYGLDPQLIGENTKIRQLLKLASDTWAGQPFTMGGYTF